MTAAESDEVGTMQQMLDSGGAGGLRIEGLIGVAVLTVCEISGLSICFVSTHPILCCYDLILASKPIAILTLIED